MYSLSDQELLRYSRHLLLPELGIEAQIHLKNSRVYIFGCGGLGHPLSFYLAAGGVGEIVLVDDDYIELSNLQRQFGFKSQQQGESKATALGTALQALNPEIRVQAITQRLSQASFDFFKSQLTQGQTQRVTPHAHQPRALLFDCTDEFDSRYLINQLSLATQTPLVSGAAIEFEGMCILLNQHATAPCYACLFPPDTQTQSRNTCADSGVFNPVLGIVGSLQAHLGLSWLTQNQAIAGLELHQSKLLRWLGRSLSMKSSILQRDPHCLVCSKI